MSQPGNEQKCKLLLRSLNRNVFQDLPVTFPSHCRSSQTAMFRLSFCTSFKQAEPRSFKTKHIPWYNTVLHDPLGRPCLVAALHKHIPSHFPLGTMKELPISSSTWRGARGFGLRFLCNKRNLPLNFLSYLKTAARCAPGVSPSFLSPTSLSRWWIKDGTHPAPWYNPSSAGADRNFRILPSPATQRFPTCLQLNIWLSSDLSSLQDQVVTDDLSYCSVIALFFFS